MGVEAVRRSAKTLSRWERVGAKRRGEGLRSRRRDRNPSSGRFAATFSHWEKGRRRRSIAPWESVAHRASLGHVDDAKDFALHPVGALHDFGVRETNFEVAGALDGCATATIRVDLVVVLNTVDLDGQGDLHTREIGDEAGDGKLAPEFKAGQTTPAQQTPDRFLRRGLLATKTTGDGRQAVHELDDTLTRFLFTKSQSAKTLSRWKRVGAKRRGEGLRSRRRDPNPSSGRFAATFSHREKGRAASASLNL